jgi:hypothetical protein
LGDDALHPLAALIADGAGDCVTINDLCDHERPDAIELNIVVLSSNVALPRTWLWVDCHFNPQHNES